MSMNSEQESELVYCANKACQSKREYISADNKCSQGLGEDSTLIDWSPITENYVKYSKDSKIDFLLSHCVVILILHSALLLSCILLYFFAEMRHRV